MFGKTLKFTFSLGRGEKSSNFWDVAGLSSDELIVVTIILVFASSFRRRIRTF